MKALLLRVLVHVGADAGPFITQNTACSVRLSLYLLCASCLSRQVWHASFSEDHCGDHYLFMNRILGCDLCAYNLHVIALAG